MVYQSSSLLSHLTSTISKGSAMTTCQPKSNEEEISSCFQVAIEKLEKVNADTKQKKTQIVQDLAKDLEEKIPTDSICNEIIHQLRHKVSERPIRQCLDEKYKDNRRVKNARKQKKKHQSTEDSAALVPLNDRQEEKKIVIDTSGKEVAEPPSIIKGSDDNDRHGNNEAQIITDKIVSYGKSSTVDGIPSSGPSYKQIGLECSSCLELQDEVTQLREAIKRISIPTADQIRRSEFTIPKENHEMVINAMNKSKNAVFVKCDESGNLVRAVPDVDNQCQ